MAQRHRADAHSVERVGQAEEGVDQHDRCAGLAVHRVAERIEWSWWLAGVLGFGQRRVESVTVGGEEVGAHTEGQARIQAMKELNPLRRP